MAAHTPGPWIWETRPVAADASLDVVLTGNGGDGVVYHSAVWPVQDADARLIAAAPELLEACRRLLAFNEELATEVHVSTHYPSADFARAAIAKAEGR